MPYPDDERKFQELILYLARLSADDLSFGSVKLNKELFIIDFNAYREWGHSVSGQEYVKRPQGPCPRRLLPVRNDLVECGALKIEESSYYGRPQLRPVALREPDLTVFSPEELRLIGEIVRRWWGVNATEMSDMSHQFVGWQLAEDGETIPYEVGLVEQIELTPEDVEWARDMEAQRARRTG